jgi:hypothetical protein
MQRLSWSSSPGGEEPDVEGVTSFTIIYHCITMQHRAKCRAGTACGGSNQCAYQPSPMLTGFSCPYKYQLKILKSMGLFDESVSFWIGVGMVAEAPIMLIRWFVPDGACLGVFSRVLGCPLPIWAICAIGIVSFFVVAWTGHKLGFGENRN